MKYLYFLLLVSISLLSCKRQKKSDLETKYEDAIKISRILIDSLMKSGKIPGIDVAVYIDGETIWSEGFGYADLEHQVPVIAGQTRFRIGSVSKPLSVAALGKLMDQGKIFLDTPVHVYVPSFPVKAFPVTLRQIGGHIGGIRHYRDNEFLSNKKYDTVTEGLEIFKDDSLLFKPGTAYSYSSYGFNLLSAAIEGVSGEPFLNYMRREVFDVLKMTSTSPDKNDSIISDRTSFYTVNEGKIVNAPCVDNSYKWAGGGFISTTTDLIKFGEAHFSEGFLSTETLEEVTTSQVLLNGDTTGYGIGWRIRFNDGEKIISHTGGSVGGITHFTIYTEKKAIIVLLSNSSNTRYGDIPDRIINSFFEVRKSLSL